MTSIRLLAIAPALSFSFYALSSSAQEAEPRGAEVQPIAVSLWNPVQTSDERSSIQGLRLNLPYGKNHDMYGFDFGIASRSTGELRGAAITLGSSVAGDVRGVQYGLILSMAGGTTYGLQEGIYAESGNLYGVQVGVVNQVEGEAQGARFAAVNISDNSSQGFELGFVNYGKRVSGLQFGIVNVADELHGVQIGVANLAKNGFFPFFPVVNAAM